jgi:hypothetical protein
MHLVSRNSHARHHNTIEIVADVKSRDRGFPPCRGRGTPEKSILQDSRVYAR